MNHVNDTVEMEEKTLEFCKKFLVENCFPPSYEEIKKGIGVGSKGSVKRYMEHLADRGEIIFKNNFSNRGSREYRIKGYCVCREDEIAAKEKETDIED